MSSSPKNQKKKKVVVIGGGTGTFALLSGLREYPLELSAIVTMADDGGSTGILRDELGVLPPGDVRQCLVALSSSPLFLRELMNYRFAQGGLKGHSFGNIFLSALEKMTGSFDAAVARAGEVLRIRGQVIPATLNKVSLAAEFQDGRVVRGQNNIHHADLGSLKRLFLEPSGRVNPKARAALAAADLIVVGPGDFYSSLVPNFLVSGLPAAVRRSKARKVYVSNLMTKAGHTSDFRASDYARVMGGYLGGRFDYLIHNTARPSPLLIKRYAHEGECYVERGPNLPGVKFVGADLLSRKLPRIPKGDPLAAQRTLIRHDPKKVARLIASLL